MIIINLDLDPGSPEAWIWIQLTWIRNTDYLLGTVGKLLKEFSDLSLVYFNAAGDSVSWSGRSYKFLIQALYIIQFLEKIMDVY